MTWKEDEFLTIEHSRLTFERESTVQPRVLPQITKEEKVDNIFLRDAKLEDYSFSGDQITLNASAGDICAEDGVVPFLGRRQRALECSAEVTIQVPKLPGVQAGLSIYQDAFRHSEIFFDSAVSSVVFWKTNKIAGPPVKVSEKLTEASATISFKIEASAKHYRLLFRGEGNDWALLGTISALEMTGCDFTGLIFGIFASRMDEACKVVFKGFHVE